MWLHIRGFLGFIILAAAVYGLYLVKWEVRDLKRQNMWLKAEITEKQRELKLLQTEWAYLNRPERLQILTTKYLPLELASGQQLVDNFTILTAAEDMPAHNVSTMSKYGNMLHSAAYNYNGNSDEVKH